MLNIRISVASAQAMAQVKAMQTQMNSLVGGMGKAGAAGGALNNTFRMPNLEKFGKNLQWTGRQLEFNFTLPLVLAGAAATKWAFANEDAMARVRKVYGDGSESVDQLNGELNALSKTFELLSSRFGVNQKEVIDIAGAWAAAGAAGVGLAKATRLTLEAMILGDMDAIQAQEGLLAVQSAYRLNTDQLRDSLAKLNIVENQTGIGMSGLIDVITRAGGTARTAGIDIDHLSAMAASLVPATGSAAQAGNALRTIISRIMAPTKEAAEVMAAFGLNTNDASWQALNGVERIEKLAVAFDGLTQSQKAIASSMIASRWQINRFDILLEDIAKSFDTTTKAQSTYAKTLANVGDMNKANAVYAKELATALGTTPRAFAILTTQVKNAMAKAILPLLPAIIAVMANIAKLVTWFTKLDPAVQGTVLTLLTLLAVVGPLLRYIGSFTLLWSILSKTILANPWVALATAVAILAYVFRDELIGAVKYVIDGMSKLPSVLASVFTNTLRVIQAFIMKAVDLLSYLNPFQRHSPSLVDNVKNGVATILQEYSTLSGVAPVIRTAASAMEAFGAATAGITQGGMFIGDIAKWREQVALAAPEAVDAFDKVVEQIIAMQGALASVGAELASQTALVGKLRSEYEAAIKPATDAIFENEQAQKRLRLEILKMEQEGGMSLDEMKDKYAKLGGEIEKLRGESEDLRQAGAGSDILGPIDAQIQALEAQRSAMEGQAAPLDEMKKKLEELQRAGEIMDLEKDLKFDPQLRELQAQEDKLKDLESAYRDIESAINDMTQGLNDFAQSAAKEGSSALEAFNAAASGDFEVPGGDAIPGIGREGGLGDIEKFNAELEAELEAALNKMGSFDLFAPLREAWNTLWTGAKNRLGPLLAPISATLQSWWGSINGWLQSQGIDWSYLFSTQSMKDFWTNFQAGIEWLGNTNLGEIAKKAFGNWTDEFENATKVGVLLWEVVGPILESMRDGIGHFIEGVAGELKNWAPMWAKFTEALKHVYNVASMVVKALAVVVGVGLVALRGVWEAVWPILRNTAVAFWDFITGITRATLEILRGVISLFLDIINGDWGKAWQDILTIVDGIWDAIYSTIKFGVDLVIGVVKGFVEGIVNFFKWLWDVLVGHSIVPDIVNGIIFWFTFLVDAARPLWNALGAIVMWAWNNVISPIFDAIVWAVNNVVLPGFTTLKSNGEAVFSAIGTAAQAAWDNVIKPVLDKISTMWDLVKTGVGAFGDGIKGVFDGMKSGITSAINIAIDVINKLIEGINKVSDILPGVDFKISPIQKLAAGGFIGPMPPGFAAGGRMLSNSMKVGGGFSTNKARAIVGEGNPLYPEFVIPTDPSHRKRAEMLFNQLGNSLGLPQYGVGGIIGGIGGAIGGAIDEGRKQAVKVAFAPILAAADQLIGQIPKGWIKDSMNGFKNSIYNWAKGEPMPHASGGILNLASGGRFTVPRSAGGVTMRVAEGHYDEEVQVLPLNGKSGRGDTHLHFYGDLVFPNIENGDDADMLIRNLESLAG